MLSKTTTTTTPNNQLSILLSKQPSTIKQLLCLKPLQVPKTKLVQQLILRSSKKQLTKMTIQTIWILDNHWHKQRLTRRKVHISSTSLTNQRTSKSFPSKAPRPRMTSMLHLREMNTLESFKRLLKE